MFATDATPMATISMPAPRYSVRSTVKNSICSGKIAPSRNTTPKLSNHSNNTKVASLPPKNSAICTQILAFLSASLNTYARLVKKANSKDVQLQKQEPVTNYQFMSADGVWRINLTSWEEFAGKLDQPLAAFIQIYQPAYFERVGLRYLNFISRLRLGLEGTPFSQLIAPCYLGPLAEADVAENAVTRCTMDFELSLRGGCRAKIHAGPGLVKRGGHEDKEVKFIFDQDLYMPGQLPLNLAVGALQTLHHQAGSLFRGAITQTLHEAMKPEAL